MKIIKSLIATFIVISIAMVGCKQKDADIKTAVEKSLANVPVLVGTTVETKDGIVTLSGQVPDETAKALATSTAQAIKGVKSVSNLITTVQVVNTPVIAMDDVLTKNVKDATKDYPTVVASVNDGVVNLTGTIKQSSLPKLLMALSALKPKKIDNKLTFN